MITATFNLSIQTAGGGTMSPPGTASTSGAAPPTAGNTFGSTISLAYGTGSGQVDNIVQQDRTLNASATETLNLFDGTLRNILNEANGFTSLKAVVIRIVANPDGAANGSALTVEPGASNPHPLFFGSTSFPAKSIKLNGPGFVDGDPVGVAVSNTAKNIKLTNADATNKVTYRIEMAGVS